jgi:transposase-like protein
MFTQKIRKRYSFGFKQKVVQEVGSGKYTKLQVSRLYGVSETAISNWLKKFGNVELKNDSIREMSVAKIERIKELEIEKKALETALGQAYLKIMNLEGMIEYIEREHNNALRLYV